MALVIDPTAPQRGAGGEPLIKDGDTKSFNNDVLVASMTVPVIVDFWAPWCGPCKQLGPMLERLVQQAAGAVRLVKINIDENQALAQQLRVQSVPMVYAFLGGRPVDAFVGAQPESKVRAFIERFTREMKSPVDELLDQAEELLGAGDAAAASGLFRRVISEDPSSPRAIAGALRCQVAVGDLKAARKLVDAMPADLKSNATVAAALSALELAEQTAGSGDVAALRAKVAADGADHQARYDLAMALYGRGTVEAAIDELLAMIRLDRDWNDEAARKQLVKILDSLGPKNPLTATTRRRLSSILFS